mgnify:CR=1 FL=1
MIDDPNRPQSQPAPETAATPELRERRAGRAVTEVRQRRALLPDITLRVGTMTFEFRFRMGGQVHAHAEDRPTEPTTVPLGLAGFGGDFSGIRRFAERDHSKIVRWSMFERGGHFAAHKAPDEVIGDVRAFYRPLR